MEAEVVRGRRAILIALIVKARTSPGTPLPGTPAAKDKVTPASVPSGEPGPLLKKARDCLDSAGRATMKAFVADDAKMMAVLDLCRAEIEAYAYARADFVALEQARTKAFFLAKEHA